MKDILEAIERVRFTNQRARTLIALSGPPASGKSTLSGRLIAHYGAIRSVIVPMDGFHLDNAILDQRGMRPHKGAPETFDVAGFAHLLNRIRQGENCYAPRFDRDLDLSINCAHKIAGQEFIIVEGNYLLLDENPWQDLHGLWDISFAFKGSIQTIEKRCIQRWLDYGMDEQAARARALGNDIVNAKRVLENSVDATHQLRFDWDLNENRNATWA